MSEEKKNLKVPAFLRRSKRRVSSVQEKSKPQNRKKKKLQQKREAPKGKKPAVKKRKKVAIVKKALPKKKPAVVQKSVGLVIHYFDNIKVAIVKFSQPVKLGQKLRFGDPQPFTQKIVSMQFDHQSIQKAPKNKEVGLEVKKPVLVGCEVFLG